MVIYRITESSPWLVRQTEVLRKATTQVLSAVGGLRNLKKRQVLEEVLVEIHRLENLGDENHQRAISELFDHETDAMKLFKWKEIFDRIEQAIDYTEQIANTIHRIIMKNS
jgi:uncharacterized protein